MDFKHLEQFFDYQPTFDDDPTFLVEKIIQSASNYLSNHEETIRKAYHFSRDSHSSGKRLSGEPYIVHPLLSTLFLMEIKPDLPSIITCILHDVIEDTPVEYDDVKKLFGQEVADLCEGLVKVSKVRYQGEERQIETIKKTFLAMANDLRVIFVKLADRIHNIQTLHYHPKEEKRRRIALETMKIYVPIAKKLGLFTFQQYLENGAFKILYPQQFERIFYFLTKRFSAGFDYITKGKKNLLLCLKKHGVTDVIIRGRLKSPRRIFEKLSKKYRIQTVHELTIKRVLDILAFRIITTNVGDCYNALGVIHAHYTPLIKKIKDYIAVPKFNGYQSIHTTILGMFAFPVEIQIRTKEMEEVAEYGVAAHASYYEHGGSVMVSERQAAWIKKMQDIVNSYQTGQRNEEFSHELDVEVLEKNIFVYTPKGDVVELPRGSTVLDFAFRVHSDVGLRFKNALINGIIKPINTTLKTGDIIEIVTYKNKYTATKHWMEFLITPTAKAKLQKFVNDQQRAILKQFAIEEYNKKADDFQVPHLGTIDDKVSKLYKGAELDRLLLQVLGKQETYHTFFKKIYDISSDDKKAKSDKITVAPASGLSNKIIIDSEPQLQATCCPECLPVFPQKIIAKSGKDGIKIHTLNCKALGTVGYEKLLEAHREGQEQQTYSCEITLEVEDKPGILVKILTIFEGPGVTLQHFMSSSLDNTVITIKILIAVNYPAKIGYILNDIKRYDRVRVTKKSLQ